MCKIIKMENLKLWRKCAIFGHDKVQYAGGVRKGNYGLGYGIYLIPDNMDLKYAVAFVYGDAMPSDLQKSVRFFWAMWIRCICRIRRRVLTKMCIRIRIL